MFRRLVGGCLLMGLIISVAKAQSAEPAHRQLRLPPISLAITYSGEHGRIASSNCGCFWFQGAGGDVSILFGHGLGFAASINGGRASDITPGFSLTKVNFIFGPRYTWHAKSWKVVHQSPSLFGEFLLGTAHAYGTVIPESSAAASKATAFSYQTGGGANLWLSPHFGLRAIELDYVYSQLPNNGNSEQNDFRLATGFVWRR